MIARDSDFPICAQINLVIQSYSTGLKTLTYGTLQVRSLALKWKPISISSR